MSPICQSPSQIPKCRHLNKVVVVDDDDDDNVDDDYDDDDDDDDDDYDNETD